jgi:hypothetical protein
MSQWSSGYDRLERVSGVARNDIQIMNQNGKTKIVTDPLDVYFGRGAQAQVKRTSAVSIANIATWFRTASGVIGGAESPFAIAVNHRRRKIKSPNLVGVDMWP